MPTDSNFIAVFDKMAKALQEHTDFEQYRTFMPPSEQASKEGFQAFLEAKYEAENERRRQSDKRNTEAPFGQMP